MTSTTPGDLADLTRLRTGWAQSAGELGATALAERLVAGTRELDADALPALDHARLLLRVGRPDEALALLPRTERAALITERPRDWNDLLALACYAAKGDDRARDALLRWGGEVDPAHGGDVVADLVSTVALQIGDLTLADDAALRLNPGSAPFRLRRRATAFMHQRSRTEPSRIAATALDCAQALLEVQPPADEDPGILTEVLDDLDQRRDHAGPTLLLTALDRRRPGSLAIETLLRTRAVRARLWRSTWWVLTLVVLFVALCAAVGRFGWSDVIPVGAAPALMITGWKSWPRLYPELSDPDNAALRRIRRTGSAGSRAMTVITAVLGAACGAIVALIASVLILTAIAPEAEFGDYPIADWGSTLVVLAGAICGPQLLLTLQRRSLANLARQRRVAGLHRDPTDLARCACWGAVGLRGRLADGYAGQHLVRSDPAVLSGLDLGPVLRPEVRQCPNLGRRWLLVPDGDRGMTVLLAGTTADPEAPSTDSGVGGYL